MVGSLLQIGIDWVIVVFLNPVVKKLWRYSKGKHVLRTYTISLFLQKLVKVIWEPVWTSLCWSHCGWPLCPYLAACEFTIFSPWSGSISLHVWSWEVPSKQNIIWISKQNISSRTVCSSAAWLHRWQIQPSWRLPPTIKLFTDYHEQREKVFCAGNIWTYYYFITTVYSCHYCLCVKALNCSSVLYFYIQPNVSLGTFTHLTFHSTSQLQFISPPLYIGLAHSDTKIRYQPCFHIL